MKNETLLTIFTPTYNRGHLLQVLYDSLKKQTNTNFEWIIVDDGSTDNTQEIVEGLQVESAFLIRYYKQLNQGKHIAINTGLEEAKGEYFFIVDSDDRLPLNSLEIIVQKFSIVRTDDTIIGVSGLRYYFDGKVIGTTHANDDIICSHLDYRFKHKIVGDKAEVFKTTMLRNYPFPKFEEEKFIPESIVWNRVGLKYKMLFFNKNVYECEYLEGGLSDNSVRLRMNNPIGVLHLYSELSKISAVGFVNRSKAYINYWRFYFCLNNKKVNLLKNDLKGYLFFPLGLMLHMKDKFILNKKS